ncbi:MAG: alpha-galactosidase [Armatimonadetes bacterium]|nr:alpha-galactosidase [Armatimonadota bacterium]
MLFVPTILPAVNWFTQSNNIAKIERDGKDLVLSNGLIERRIQVESFVATTSMRRMDTGQEFIRSTEPEGKLMVDGKDIWVGGTTAAPDRAFLTPAWLETMRPDPRSMKLTGIEFVPVASPIPYKLKSGKQWVPAGKAVKLSFQSESLQADVRLEIYDNMPVIGKQIRLQNTSAKTIRVETFTSERLAMVEGQSAVEALNRWQLPNATVITNMGFGGSSSDSNPAVHWETDPAFQTQVSYELKTPCVLDIHPPVGPSVDLKPGESMDSLRSFILLHDSEDLERKSMGVRAMYRKLAPWTQDNPLMLHIQSSDDTVVKRAIDQAAECGYEMAIISFWSGLDMEDLSTANITKWRAIREYADAKGIRLGGYSLLASRSIDAANDVINVKTGKPGGAIFGSSPCLCSAWGQEYFRKIKTFITKTGFKVFEHDGNYPGDACASPTHPGHRGYEDSQWKQFQMMEDLYAWLRERNVFMNVPDTYFLNGSNKSAMGYRESNWSLPREQQHVHARQNLFDGTFDKTPSMGWMFVPLTEYQGGGKAATIEPLKDNLVDYELHFANTLGYGAQACWRGTRLYDAPETKAVVVRMVNWFKKYREILESDVVHLRRADGRRLDYVLHANPNASPRAMLVVYNPTDSELSETVAVPLQYAGISKGTTVKEREGKAVGLKVKDGVATLEVKVGPRGWSYFSIK